MAKKKLSASQLRKFLRLIEGERMPLSEFTVGQVTELREEGFLTTVSHGSRTSCYVQHPAACRRYVETRYLNGRPLESALQLLEENGSGLERSELVRATGDSKYKKTRTFRGFLVNCCDDLPYRLGSEEGILSPLPGSALFVQDFENFHIPADVLVVGVENGQNFRDIRRERALFGDERVLFVSRYPQSSELRSWLCQIPNRYLHFGDFDLAGIHIFLTEFYSYLGERATYFIPDDLEEKLKHGSTDLYNEQYAAFQRMEVTDARLQPLVEMIHRYRRTYEQEGYIPEAETPEK